MLLFLLQHGFLNALGYYENWCDFFRSLRDIFQVVFILILNFKIAKISTKFLGINTVLMGIYISILLGGWFQEFLFVCRYISYFWLSYNSFKLFCLLISLQKFCFLVFLWESFEKFKNSENKKRRKKLKHHSTWKTILDDCNLIFLCLCLNIGCCSMF